VQKDFANCKAGCRWKNAKYSCFFAKKTYIMPVKPEKHKKKTRNFLHLL
jgi:hypothetical protein